MMKIIKNTRIKEIVKRPIVTAGLILGFIVLWILTGLGGGDGTANGDTNANLNKPDEIFLVRAANLNAVDYVETVQVRGRTEALRTVELKAEEEGRVIATPIEKGQRVKRGDLICQISPNDREANLSQAKALAAEKQLQYDANLELAKEGFRSDTQVAAAKAELDSATAQVQRAQVAVDNTKIRAPFDGLLNDRAVEVGDFLQVGNTCGILLTEDPYLVVGEVADRHVGSIYQGQPATVELSDGTLLEGKVRYISKAARIETRTFRVEIEVPNPERNLRDGMTADILIPAAKTKAHFLSPSVLVLKADGSVGVRVVNNEKLVEFYPIEIIGNEPNGMWVKGLPDNIQLITTGHNFVKQGDEVNVELVESGDLS